MKAKNKEMQKKLVNEITMSENFAGRSILLGGLHTARGPPFVQPYSIWKQKLDDL